MLFEQAYCGESTFMDLMTDAVPPTVSLINTLIFSVYVCYSTAEFKFKCPPNKYGKMKTTRIV